MIPNKTPCIYKITNVITQKFYIGSTVNFNKRKNTHLSDLRKNKHHNHKLQNSFNKHGIDFFRFEILEVTEDLATKEQYYFDTMKPYFNIFKTSYFVTGENHPMFGKTHTKEAIEKIKLARKNQIISHSE